jgi:hypothetical protein
MASEYQGRLLFNGLPVPGATVTASQVARNLLFLPMRMVTTTFRISRLEPRRAHSP